MDALGLVFSYSQRENLRELTNIRTLSSLPFAGKYRIIDFILSNYVNSGIHEVSIITRNNYHSLVDHLGAGTEWDLSRKRGGLRILSPLSHPGAADTGLYRGTVEAIWKNIYATKRSMAEYVILSGSNFIYNIDYEEVIKSHIERRADITAVYTLSKEGYPIPPDVAMFKMDENEKIYELNYGNEEITTSGIPWSMGIFVMRRSLLESLVADTIAAGLYDFYRDIIHRLAGTLNISGFEYKKHFFEISTVNGYMKANMSLLDEDIRKKTFENLVYTKVKDSVPVQYCSGCSVSNSIIADGCKIEGTVINSVLSRGVKIGKGSVVKNSVVMQNTEIMRNVLLDQVILDKDVIVRDNRQLAGHDTYPVVIAKKSIV